MQNIHQNRHFIILFTLSTLLFTNCTQLNEASIEDSSQNQLDPGDMFNYDPSEIKKMHQKSLQSVKKSTLNPEETTKYAEDMVDAKSETVKDEVDVTREITKSTEDEVDAKSDCISIVLRRIFFLFNRKMSVLPENTVNYNLYQVQIDPSKLSFDTQQFTCPQLQRFAVSFEALMDGLEAVKPPVVSLSTYIVDFLDDFVVDFHRFNILSTHLLPILPILLIVSFFTLFLITRKKKYLLLPLASPFLWEFFRLYDRQLIQQKLAKEKHLINCQKESWLPDFSSWFRTNECSELYTQSYQHPILQASPLRLIQDLVVEFSATAGKSVAKFMSELPFLWSLLSPLMLIPTLIIVILVCIRVMRTSDFKIIHGRTSPCNSFPLLDRRDIQLDDNGDEMVTFRPRKALMSAKKVGKHRVSNTFNRRSRLSSSR